MFRIVTSAGVCLTLMCAAFTARALSTRTPHVSAARPTALVDEPRGGTDQSKAEPAPGGERGRRCAARGRVRSAPNKYVVGWCLPPGGRARRLAGDRRMIGYDDVDPRREYVESPRVACGWMAGYSGAGLPRRDRRVRGVRCSAAGIAESDFADEVADDTCVTRRCRAVREFPEGGGRPKYDLLPARGAPSPRVRVAKDCPRYANLDRGGRPIDWVGTLPARRRDGVTPNTVAWRYSARGTDYVMVHATNAWPYDEFGWTFVAQACLEGRPARRTSFARVPFGTRGTSRQRAHAVVEGPLRRPAVDGISRLQRG